MRAHVWNERRLEFNFPIRIDQQIDRLLAAQMAAFHQKWNPVPRRELSRGSAHLLQCGDAAPQERRDFVEIWRHHRGERENALFIQRNRVRTQQPVAARGDHDRINDDWRTFFQRVERGQHLLNDLARMEHPGLHGCDGKSIEAERDLLPHDARLDWLDGRNLPGDFRDDARDRSQPVGAVRGECLQISLRARPRAVVGPCDGEDDRRLAAHAATPDSVMR